MSMDSDIDGSTTDRVVLTKEPQKGKATKALEALSSRFRQSVQTKTSTPSMMHFRAGLQTVEPADGVDEYYEVYTDTAIVFASIWNFASDVWEPGYRIEAENEEAIEWLEDEWLPQAAVLHGGKHNDFLPFGKATTVQRWARGGALIEHVRENPDNPDSLITGLNFIPPETVSFVPYEHKPILVDPDPPAQMEETLPNEIPETRRGEYPAFIQYHKNAPVPTRRDPIPLSQNDVTRTIFNGDAAGVGTDLDQFWGTPVTEIISEDVAGFKNILRDKETAIKNKAYGLWRLAFDREVMEYTDVDPESGEQIDVTEIIEWSKEDKEDVADEIENEMGPGSILTHDGAIEMDRLDGDVPDLIDDLEFYISNITAALPTPLFIIGFETNINQFVTQSQDERYQRLIKWEREALERTYSDVLTRVLNSADDAPDSEWVEMKIEPPEEESPVLSMSQEDIDKLQAWASAFDSLRGDIPVDMFVDPQQLLELILQMPEDAAPDIEEMDIDDAAVDEGASGLIDLVDQEMGDEGGGDGDGNGDDTESSDVDGELGSEDDVSMPFGELGDD